MRIDTSRAFPIRFGNPSIVSTVSHVAGEAVQRGLSHAKPIPGFANLEPPSADLLVRGQNACDMAPERLESQPTEFALSDIARRRIKTYYKRNHP